MAQFYAVVRTATHQTTDCWYYWDKSNARNKFHEIANKIKNRWGYNTSYGSEYPNGDFWNITENKVEYTAYGYDELYDYNDRVVIKSVRTILKPKLKFED